MSRRNNKKCALLIYIICASFLSILRKWDYSAAIQELFSFAGIGTKQNKIMCQSVTGCQGGRKGLYYVTIFINFRYLRCRWQPWVVGGAIGLFKNWGEFILLLHTDCFKRKRCKESGKDLTRQVKAETCLNLPRGVIHNRSNLNLTPSSITKNGICRPDVSFLPLILDEQ